MQRCVMYQMPGTETRLRVCAQQEVVTEFMVRGHVNLATRSFRALAARTIQHLWSRQVDCSSRARCASRTFSSGRRPRQLAAWNLFTLLLHALPVHSCMSLMPDSSLRSGRSCRKCARSRRCVYIDESINITYYGGYKIVKPKRAGTKATDQSRPNPQQATATSQLSPHCHT